MLSEWQAIVPPAEPGACNVLLADSLHPLDFRIGRDHRGRYVFQLDGDGDNAARLEVPKVSAFTCEIETLEDGRSRLVLILGNSADYRNFALMCTSLMLATEQLAPSQSGKGLVMAVEELHRWQEMLRQRSERLLSKSERIGLFGELLFLRDVLCVRLGWESAVRSWVGPGRDEQDFVVGGNIYEIKTQIITTDRRIRISSEDQLDPTQGRILLCNQGIAPVPATELASRTLNSIVSEIRSHLAGAGARSPELLEIALFATGYEERPEYDQENWVLVDRTYFEVIGDFPRIERQDLRAGVEMVSYSIRFADCLAYTVTEAIAFQEATR